MWFSTEIPHWLWVPSRLELVPLATWHISEMVSVSRTGPNEFHPEHVSNNHQMLSQFSCSPFPVYLSSALTSSSLRNLLPLLNIRFPLATNNPDKATVFSNWVVFLIVTVSVSVYQPPYLIFSFGHYFGHLTYTLMHVTCEEQPIWICHCSELFCNTKIGFFHPRTSFQVESFVWAEKCSYEELKHSLFGRFLIP